MPSMDTNTNINMPNVSNGLVNPAPEPTINVDTGINSNPINMMPDTPLFTNPAPQVSMPTDNYIIPVETPKVEPVITSSLDKIKEFIASLNDIKVNYKEYNNDNENCLIITIEK